MFQKSKYRCWLKKTGKKIQWTIYYIEVLRIATHDENWSRAGHALSEFQVRTFSDSRGYFQWIPDPPLGENCNTTRTPLRLWEMDKRWRWNQIWNLCSQVMKRINLEKFYYDLNKKLNTATNSLEDSAGEVNQSKY